VVLLHLVLKLSFRVTLFLGLIWPGLWLATYFYVLQEPNKVCAALPSSRPQHPSSQPTPT
jgi:hypothetical protein